MILLFYDNSPRIGSIVLVGVFVCAGIIECIFVCASFTYGFWLGKRLGNQSIGSIYAHGFCGIIHETHCFPAGNFQHFWLKPGIRVANYVNSVFYYRS